MLNLNDLKNYFVIIAAVGFLVPRYYYANFQNLPVYGKAIFAIFLTNRPNKDNFSPRWG